MPLFSPRASRASRQKHLTTWASLNSLQITCAMNLLASGVDIATVALWLGHDKLDSVNAYVHADLTMKERALDRRTPLKTRASRYRPSDALLGFLEGL